MSNEKSNVKEIALNIATDLVCSGNVSWINNGKLCKDFTSEHFISFTKDIEKYLNS